jgi:hypothetical protein
MGGYGFNPNNGELRPNRLSRLEEIKLEMQEVVSKIVFQNTLYQYIY